MSSVRGRGERLYGGVVTVDRPAPDNVARLDHNAARSITRMMQNGLAIDVPRLRTLGVRCLREMAELEGEIEGLCGVKVNPASGPQVADLLFSLAGARGGEAKENGEVGHAGIHTGNRH